MSHDENHEVETTAGSDQSRPKLGCFVVSFLIGMPAIIFLNCAGLYFVPESVFYLATGWFFFIRKVVPKVEIVWSDVALSVCFVLAFVVGFHRFVKRTLNDVSEERLIENPQLNLTWRWRSTFAVTGAVAVLFVTSISMIGLTHQIVWFTTSDEPSLRGMALDLPQAATRKNSLKPLGMAVHEMHDEHGAWAGFETSPNGQLHGWPAGLLPYLMHDHTSLHQQINFDQSWRHESNRAAFKTHVDFFEAGHPDIGPTADGFAPIGYSANSHLLTLPKLRLRNITDGSPNTILMGEIGAEYPAWGDPMNWRDPAIGINSSPHGFGFPEGCATQFLLWDGSVRSVNHTIDNATLRALATPAGGEVVGDF